MATAREIINSYELFLSITNLWRHFKFITLEYIFISDIKFER